MTQLNRIIAILQHDGRIDNFRCIHERLSLRLGACIWDLKHRGYKIRSEERPDKNTIYYLIAKPAPRQLQMTV
jgi:Helix-turn-helix domain